LTINQHYNNCPIAQLVDHPTLDQEVMSLISGSGFVRSKEIKSYFSSRYGKVNWQGPNVSTIPITAMGCQQCLPLSVVQMKGKHCRKPHCRNGVVDTFRQELVPGSFQGFQVLVRQKPANKQN
jgi:hypothetical protein